MTTGSCKEGKRAMQQARRERRRAERVQIYGEFRCFFTWPFGHVYKKSAPLDCVCCGFHSPHGGATTID